MARTTLDSARWVLHQIAASGVAMLVLIVGGRLAHAFPPYQSTDAGTADPWAVEPRLGVKLGHDQGDDEVTAPAMRLNLGFPHRFELVSELDVLPEEEAIGDAAIGLKWVPLGEELSLGAEVLALLPLREGDDGAGVAAILAATARGERLRAT